MGIANRVSNSVEKETKVMWCKNCNLETNEAICPVCGLETSEDLPVEIYWCNDCRIPVIHVSTAADKGICPVCHGKTRYLTADLRPVFPEERLLIALLLDKAPEVRCLGTSWNQTSGFLARGKRCPLCAVRCSGRVSGAKREALLNSICIRRTRQCGTCSKR